MTSTPSMIVTGGASGIGAEIARQASAAGYRVGLLDVNTQGAEQLAASLPDAVALPGSNCDETAVAAAFDAFGTPDALVNNAGIVRFGPLVNQSLTDWQQVLDVNLTGAFVCGRELARRAIAAGHRACVVNIASINGVVPGPNAGAYGSSKSAVVLLSQQMAVEWGPAGLRVNSVSPGMIDAGMSTPIFADPQAREMRTSSIPARRPGTADDIARAVLWLCSDDAEYVSGHNLLVDGALVPSILALLPRPASVDGVSDSTGEPAEKT